MTNYRDMMILPTDKRRDYVRKVYTLELTRLHATGVCVWPIDRLPAMVDNVMAGLAKTGRCPMGPAWDATMKFFALRTQKEVREFIG